MPVGVQWTSNRRRRMDWFFLPEEASSISERENTSLNVDGEHGSPMISLMTAYHKLFSLYSPCRPAKGGQRECRAWKDALRWSLSFLVFYNIPLMPPESIVVLSLVIDWKWLFSMWFISSCFHSSSWTSSSLWSSSPFKIKDRKNSKKPISTRIKWVPFWSPYRDRFLTDPIRCRNLVLTSLWMPNLFNDANRKNSAPYGIAFGNCVHRRTSNSVSWCWLHWIPACWWRK